MPSLVAKGVRGRLAAFPCTGRHTTAEDQQIIDPTIASMELQEFEGELSGGRLSSPYDALSEIAPVVYLSMDTELGVVESVRKNVTMVASIFGQVDDVANPAVWYTAEGGITVLDMMLSDLETELLNTEHKAKGRSRRVDCGDALLAVGKV